MPKPPQQPPSGGELLLARRYREETQFRRPLFREVHRDPSAWARVHQREWTALLQKDPSLQSLSRGEFLGLALWQDCYRTLIRTALKQAARSLLSLVREDDALQRRVRGILDQSPPLAASTNGEEAVEITETLLENIVIQALCRENPAVAPLQALLPAPGDGERLPSLVDRLEQIPFGQTHLKDWLQAPLQSHPDSLPDQLRYLREVWAPYLQEWHAHFALSFDLLAEERRFRGAGPGPVQLPDYDDSTAARYSPDQDWMPSVVMIAKNTLVWLHQLSKEFHQPIRRLDEIPEAALQQLAERGFNALWLIGIWERSTISKTIKRRMGNPEAEASAYSLKRYEVARTLGGNQALEALKEKAGRFGIRLASDMVPNHTGLDADWIIEHPEYYLSVPEPPFPGYRYSGENLSEDPRVEIRLEDHYYDRSDAAVTFQAVYPERQEVCYIYHGNDGTSMPWNDTAQLNYLRADVREAVLQTILRVARTTPIIRFDAAMTLARRHIRRLWYPAPGEGGAIPSRAFAALSEEEFRRQMPREFWREVVDRVAEEAPGTLLLAEAFWMMEGYFVRTLGMHRVYNSAFMNMLKAEDNAAYRQLIKSTLEFDPDILQRYVNFLNNPDEETARVGFGDGDKYFAVTTLMVTLPGLPLFGHGQWEGYTEKYGMEFHRPLWEESPEPRLVERHAREITPLLRHRSLFASVQHFALFDCIQPDGTVDENVFAYTNRQGEQRALVVVNNVLERTRGRLHTSVAFRDRTQPELRRVTLLEALAIQPDDSTLLAFQEQRSGLWFLRRTTRLAREGLEILLDGYAAQVYWNFRILEDTPDGDWTRLEEELGGEGVADLEEALRGSQDRYRRRRLWEDIQDQPAVQSLPAGLLSALRERPAEELERIRDHIESHPSASVSSLEAVLRGMLADLRPDSAPEE